MPCLLSALTKRFGAITAGHCSDGYTYERAAIEAWLSSGRDTSPMTNEQLEDKVRWCGGKEVGWALPKTIDQPMTNEQPSGGTWGWGHCKVLPSMRGSACAHSWCVACERPWKARPPSVSGCRLPDSCRRRRPARRCSYPTTRCGRSWRWCCSWGSESGGSERGSGASRGMWACAGRLAVRQCSASVPNGPGSQLGAQESPGRCHCTHCTSVVEGLLPATCSCLGAV